MKLGKLHEVDIRKVWPHEQYDFSKWLAAEENIQELGNVLNLSLTDIETERLVGSYRCDILCRDEITGKVVLIENQLEQTNHDHLGKILTYASGLDASVVVWVVAAARDEHASAIEWLNKHTDDSISFFLIEIHAYKIGDSEPAPQFKIIEQPNDFAKIVKRISQDKEMNESQGCRLEFWTQFNDILEQRGKPFNKRKATTDHWYSVAVGSSECQISIDLVNKEHKIRVGLGVSFPRRKHRRGKGGRALWHRRRPRGKLQVRQGGHGAQLRGHERGYLLRSRGSAPRCRLETPHRRGCKKAREIAQC